uniref:Uncharacterized protein n=1 Tax=Eutreptiella gymnastica TaxID=73025 RepID=A0A7S4CTI2_9EUGL
MPGRSENASFNHSERIMPDSETEDESGSPQSTLEEDVSPSEDESNASPGQKPKRSPHAEASSLGMKAKAVAKFKGVKVRNKLAQEVQVLQAEVGRLNRLKLQLSTGRDIIVCSFEDLKKRHEKEEEQIRAEVMKLQETIQEISASTERVPHVKRYICDFYMEFMDIPPELDPESKDHAEFLARHRMDIERKGPPSVLDALKQNLRKLLADKESEMLAMKTAIAQSAEMKQQDEEDSQAQMAQLQAEMDSAASKAEQMAKSKERLLEERGAVQTRLQARITELQQQNKELRAVIREREKTVETLSENVALRDRILMAKETRLGRCQKLEQQIEREKRQQQLESSNLRAQASKQRSMLEKDSKYFERGEKDHQALILGLEEVERQRVALSHALSPTNVEQHRAQAQTAKQTKERIRQEKEDICSAITELKRTNARLREENAVIKEEYTSLFAAIQHTQDRFRQENARQLMTASSTVRQSTGSWKQQVKSMQEKCDQKDAEISQLKRRYHRLVLAEFHQGQKYQTHKAELEEELKEVKLEHQKLAGLLPRMDDKLGYARPHTASPSVRTKAATPTDSDPKPEAKPQSPRGPAQSPRGPAQSVSPTVQRQSTAAAADSGLLADLPVQTPPAFSRAASTAVASPAHTQIRSPLRLSQSDITVSLGQDDSPCKVSQCTNTGSFSLSTNSCKKLVPRPGQSRNRVPPANMLRTSMVYKT